MQVYSDLGAGGGDRTQLGVGSVPPTPFSPLPLPSFHFPSPLQFVAGDRDKVDADVASTPDRTMKEHNIMRK